MGVDRDGTPVAGSGTLLASRKGVKCKLSTTAYPMNLNTLQTQLSRHRLEDVAAGTGLSYWTVRRYRAGLVKDPPPEIVDRLVAWLEAQP